MTTWQWTLTMWLFLVLWSLSELVFGPGGPGCCEPSRPARFCSVSCCHGPVEVMVVHPPRKGDGAIRGDGISKPGLHSQKLWCAWKMNAKTGKTRQRKRRKGPLQAPLPIRIPPNMTRRTRWKEKSPKERDLRHPGC